MRRSHAPSIQFESLKKTNPELTLPSVGKGKKEVNHLEKYSIALGKTKLEEDKKETEVINLAEINQKKKGKNVRMTSSSPAIYFLVYWRSVERFKDDQKGYGVLEVLFDSANLYSKSAKQIGKVSLTRSDDEEDPKESQKVKIKKAGEVFFQEGFSVLLNKKLVEILKCVEASEYLNGQVFLKMDGFIRQQKRESSGVTQVKKVIYIAASKRPTPGKFQVRLKGSEATRKRTEPLWNPREKDALVLWPGELYGENKVPVVVDPKLSAKLRPHQRSGVQFMFDCCMGFKKGYDGKGCILADDMGLGKTIQAIALLWTLLKQGPNGEPAAKKACIVAPSSLVGNWCKELNKWLGNAIVFVAIGESTKKGLSRLSELQFGKADVLVISYDQLRIYSEDLRKIPQIELIICDEGHKLKNAEIKTTKAVASLPAQRRLILSGTPIQNNLDEFYAMVSFVNPKVFSDNEQFRNAFQIPIEASRVPDASEEDIRVGRERSKALSQLTANFILRRTQMVNQKYLPPKVEYTVFCKLTDFQKRIYKFLTAGVLGKGNGFQMAGALPLITTLKKLCNCPELIYNGGDKEDGGAINFSAIAHLFTDDFNIQEYQPQFSGKLQFLDTLLAEIRAKTDDKVVIISNYTQTLEVLGRMCKKRGYPYFQLDGSTPVSKRQKLVDLFNEPQCPEFIFLLSSKAGGVGLNLIGANHLILYDPDWNPANDAQAMARIWREGQKKNVSIYRTLSTGTIEEKIFQRQITKLALSSSVVESNTDNAPDFAPKDLKDIFTLREDTICDTHDMLGCRCSRSKKIPRHQREKIKIDELEKYDHYDDLSGTNDPFLQKASNGVVSFVFANRKGGEKSSSEDQTQIIGVEAGDGTIVSTITVEKEEGDSKDSSIATEDEDYSSSSTSAKGKKRALDDDDDEESSKPIEKSKFSKTTEKSEPKSKPKTTQKSSSKSTKGKEKVVVSSDEDEDDEEPNSEDERFIVNDEDIDSEDDDVEVQHSASEAEEDDD